MKKTLIQGLLKFMDLIETNLLIVGAGAARMYASR